MLDKLQKFETAQAKTIGKFLQTALKLGAKYTASKHLTPEENKLLAERQKFLSGRLEIRTDETKSQILSFKTQAENFSERLAKINRGQNSLRELAEIENEPRPSFAFLTENLTQLVQNARLKMDFFVTNENFILNVVNLWEIWNENYKSFKTKLREELAAVCREDGIDEEIFGLALRLAEQKISD